MSWNNLIDPRRKALQAETKTGRSEYIDTAEGDEVAGGEYHHIPRILPEFERIMVGFAYVLFLKILIKPPLKKEDHYPLPFLELFLQTVAGSEMLSILLDGFSGLNQIHIDIWVLY